MPKRTDLRKILVLGSGPIVIGQACEFDYSGTQGCRALREEGYEVVLVNSNPATIMTDPEMADRTYIEPVTWEVVAKIIEVERPDALLPTLGGQTGLNTAMDLHKQGVLKKYGVEMIGANAGVIDKAEDRQRFKEAMIKIGLSVPRSGVVRYLPVAVLAAYRGSMPTSDGSCRNGTRRSGPLSTSVSSGPLWQVAHRASCRKTRRPRSAAARSKNPGGGSGTRSRSW